MRWQRLDDGKWGLGMRTSKDPSAGIRARNYRQKVIELRETAASASTAELRDQFTTLARQFEQLAESEEILSQTGVAGRIKPGPPIR
jgi:hypothetical protein